MYLKVFLLATGDNLVTLANRDFHCKINILVLTDIFVTNKSRINQDLRYYTNELFTFFPSLNLTGPSIIGYKSPIFLLNLTNSLLSLAPQIELTIMSSFQFHCLLV